MTERCACGRERNHHLHTTVLGKCWRCRDGGNEHHAFEPVVDEEAVIRRVLESAIEAAVGFPIADFPNKPYPLREGVGRTLEHLCSALAQVKAVGPAREGDR